MPFWLIFEAVPTKLPHYVLPTYPAIAILIVMAMEQGALLAQNMWSRIILRLVPLIALVLVAAGIGLWFWSGRLPGTAAFVALPFLLWLALHLMRDIGRERSETSLLACVALSFCAYLYVFSGIMTAGPFEAWRMSPRLAEAARQVLAPQKCSSYSAATVGFNEPSLVFLTGTDLLLTSGEEAARFVQGGACRVAFVDARAESAFKSALTAPNDFVAPLRVTGLNLNGGRKLDMGVYVQKASAP